MDFKELFSQMLEEKGLTQAEFAKKADIPKTTVNGWLVANRLPDYNALIKLSKYFNVSADYLLGVTDDDSPQWSTALETPPKASSNQNLSSDEVEVLDYLRQLPQPEKDAVIDLARQQATKFGYKQQDKK